MSFFDRLADDTLLEIALHLSPSEIDRFRVSNLRLDEVLNLNNSFWHRKFIQDYKFDQIGYQGSWRDLYLAYSNVWVTGNSAEGQLGLGDVEYVDIFTQIPNFNLCKQVSAGRWHTLFIDLENNVWVCGENKEGQLGLPDTRSHFSPVQIPNINLLGKAQQVSTGVWHTLFIDLENNVWVCGSNKYGQLGLPDTRNQFTPVQIPDFNLLGKARQVSAGYLHTVIIDLEYNVWTCGHNDNGQLGLGDYKSRSILTKIKNMKIKQVSAGGSHTVFIDLENNVWVCGSNGYGQLGLGDYEDRTVPKQIKNLKAQQVSAGSDHTVIIDMNNNVLVFGNNEYGQLGIGDIEDENSSVLITIGNLLGKARQVSAGETHTALIDLENNVWVWGDNAEGQLGLGDTESRDIPVQVPNIKARQVSANGIHTVIIGTKIRD